MTSSSPEAETAKDSQSNQAVSTLLNHAQQAFAHHDLDAADGWLMRAVQINPTDPEIYYQMALLRQAQGQKEQARQLVLRTLSLNPNKQMKQNLNNLLLQL
ncbi:MAG: tetratricopeptide repeat protein [Endozoicomonas sp. (ex Botrylloides leachii)]|nr:tetratricopeptide repeat protein [Endozoicomonas sp. (ex Botrylloides leachii)]